MNCPKCGAENPDNIQLCQTCSWLLSSTAAAPVSADAKTSGMATASLVLGILSVFTCFITAIPAIILGIVALVKINKSGGQLKGNGFAVAGIAAPAVALPFVAILMAILMPALARARGLAQRIVCGTNLKGLSSAMIVYADEYGNYPTPSQWCDILIENNYIPRKQFSCPSAKEGPCNYAMNEHAAQAGPSSHPDMVLLFETHAGWNQSGGPEDITAENHFDDGCNVVFNDGSVQFVRTEDLHNLRWTAQQLE